MRHTPGLTMFDGATHPGLRPPLSERGWRSSAPLIIKVMRQPIPSRRGVAEGRGPKAGVCRTINPNINLLRRVVSHYEAKHIPTDKTIEADASIRLNAFYQPKPIAS